MSGAFPIYETYSECFNECGSFVSYCVGAAPLIVCQLNILVFLACIFLAVFTGVVIPVLCLLCCVTNWCAEAKRIWRAGRTTDEEMMKLNPRSVQVSVSESGTPVVSVQPVPTPQRKPVMFKGAKSFA
ncbi:hypothetical protein Y032_0248g91 [Ancylostoma ceylanicum]|uniref:Uncharacterized protein n=1 Tax=Ancylostoma ceylanicum TaxID=53326 RepID=A0A016SCG0_9BILA|nr:hypothetical protein Y032_0248g91 [Ancylostoma ceylanicum]